MLRPTVIAAALAASGAFLLIGLGSFLIAGKPANRAVAALHSAHDRKQERALAYYLTRHGAASCSPDVYVVDKNQTFVSAVRAVGFVRCDAIGTGADVVGAFRFRTPGDLNGWEDDQRRYLRGRDTYGTCDLAPGESSWARASGLTAGRLFCEPASPNTLVWTDRASLTGFYAESHADPLAALLTWWATHIRGRPVSMGSGMQTLRRMFGRALEGGLYRCHSFMHPLADAGLQCDNATVRRTSHLHVEQLLLYHFRAAAQLDDYFKTATQQVRAPTNTTVSCNPGALASYPYFKHGQADGRVLCFPSGNSEWLMWTIDADNVVVLIRRDDESVTALAQAFLALPH